MNTLQRTLSVSRYLYANADLTIFRVLFAGSSFSLGLTIFLQPTLFQNPVFGKMREMFPFWAWAALFIFHGLLVSWRLIDNRGRTHIALSINMFGFALWALFVLLQDYALSSNLHALSFTINNSVERVIVLFAFLTIPATGTRRELLSP